MIQDVLIHVNTGHSKAVHCVAGTLGLVGMCAHAGCWHRYCFVMWIQIGSAGVWCVHAGPEGALQDVDQQVRVQAAAQI